MHSVGKFKFPYTLHVKCLILCTYMFPKRHKFYFPLGDLRWTLTSFRLQCNMSCGCPGFSAY